MGHMRIALVSMHTSPAAVPGSGDAGGMNVVVAEAGLALAARGHEVVLFTRATTLLAPGEHAFNTQIPEAERTTVDRGSITLIALPAGALDLRKEQLPAVIPEFAAGIRELGAFDAVHAHYWLSGVAALEALRGSSLTPAMTFHTLAAKKNAHLAPGDRPEPQLRVDAEKRLSQNSFVVACSLTERSAIDTYCGQPPHGSALVHPGVDTSLFHPSHDTQIGAPFRVTVLGRVQPLKGQDLAVRAMGELAEIDPLLSAQTELVIAGEATPGAEDYAASLRDLAAQYGITDRVRFLPAQTREQSAELLRGSSLVLVPSHSETFGLTALEAGASGVPVIVSGHTGLVEAAPANRSGVHMVDRDPRHWAEAIASLLRDPHRREAIAISTREHALSHDWRAHADALEQIYANLQGTQA